MFASAGRVRSRSEDEDSSDRDAEGSTKHINSAAAGGIQPEFVVNNGAVGSSQYMRQTTENFAPVVLQPVVESTESSPLINAMRFWEKFFCNPDNYQ